MTEEAQCLHCLLHLVACKSVLFVMVFYSAKVGRGMVTYHSIYAILFKHYI